MNLKARSKRLLCLEPCSPRLEIMVFNEIEFFGKYVEISEMPTETIRYPMLYDLNLDYTPYSLLCTMGIYMLLEHPSHQTVCTRKLYAGYAV